MAFEIQWQAPEYEFHEKGVSWYWLSIILAAIIIAFAVWQKNFLFGFFIVIAEVLFIVWGNKQPRLVSFAMNESGLTIENAKTYQWKEFGSVGVDDRENGWVELVFIFRARFKTPLKVILPIAQLDAFRTNTKILLKEVPYESTLLDAIEKLLHF